MLASADLSIRHHGRDGAVFKTGHGAGGGSQPSAFYCFEGRAFPGGFTFLFVLLSFVKDLDYVAFGTRGEEMVYCDESWFNVLWNHHVIPEISQHDNIFDFTVLRATALNIRCT